MKHFEAPTIEIERFELVDTITVSKNVYVIPVTLPAGPSDPTEPSETTPGFDTPDDEF